MKRVLYVVFVFCLAIGLHAERLTIGTIRGMMRYSPAIVQTLSNAGYEAVVQPFDTQEALMKAVETGAVDGAFFLAQPVVSHIKGAVLIPVRLMYTDFHAISTDPSVTVSNLGDLKKYTVGIVKGHPGHIAVTRGIKVIETESDAEQFKQLSQGRYQVAIAVKELIPLMAKVAALKKYYIQQPPLMRTPTFFILGRTKADHKKKIEEAFKKALESGEWDRQITAIGQ